MSKKYFIPDRHIEEVYRLADALRAEKSGLNHYRLWLYIKLAIPELEALPAGTQLKFADEDILFPYVEEIDKESKP